MYGCNCHIGCLSGQVTRVGDELVGSIHRVGKGLCGHVSMVCSLSKDAYLNVVPDVVWLTPEMISGEFDIYSNVVWRID